jgi:two-component SAPR family response regulator
MTKLEEIEKVKKEADRLMMNKLAEIEELKNKIADLEESLKSKDYFEKPDYKFLVNENHRLEQQYLEVMADNKKLARQVEDKMDQLRKSGL